MNNPEFKEVILREVKLHPVCEICDLVKLCFQNEFGCSHLSADERESRKMLEDEFLKTNRDGNFFITEDIGNGETRLYLDKLPKTADLSLINRAFFLSAESKGTTEGFVKKLDFLTEAAKNKEIPFKADEVEAFINNYKSNGLKALSHSEKYRSFYEPSYRVIKTKYIKPLKIALDISERFGNNKKTVITVDGYAASGKTTFSGLLGEILKADVIHTDDFFLPKELRTEKRLNEPGGNIHYERFKEQVVNNLKSNKAFTYDRYNCKNPAEKKRGFCLNRKYTIIEGAYSGHPYFGNYSDYRIFFKCEDIVQNDRILKRNGKEMLEKFNGIWIPMEMKYFKEFDTEKNSDCRIIT